MTSKKPVEPGDLYRLTLVSNPRVAPNGEKITFTVTRPKKDEYFSAIWLADEDKFRPITGGPRDTCQHWSPDSSMIAYQRGTKEGTSKLMILSADGGEPWILAEFKQPITRIVWSPNSEFIAVETREIDEEWKKYTERDVLLIDRMPPWFNGSGWIFDRPRTIYLVSYPSGGLTRISPDEVNSIYPTWSPTGRYLAYARFPHEKEPYKGEVVVYDVETGEEKVIVKDMNISGLSWSPNSDVLAVRGHFFERGLVSHHKIYFIDITSGEKECATCGLGLNTINTVNSDVRGPSCNEGMAWDYSGWFYFQVHDAGRVQIYRVKPGGEPVLFLEAGNGVVDEFDINGREPLLAYTFMTATKPKELYIHRGGSPVRITDFNDWLERERTLAEPVHHIVEVGEETLDLWILPPADDIDCSKCLPWILYVHGGPKTSFGNGFMFEFHVLSSKGFAIVYGNPHGSDGYSEEFADIRGKFGTIDFNDIMHFVNIAPSLDGRLDQDRVAIVGGSYGGWMVNYALTKTNIFKTAISMRGCSNWTSFWGASDIGWYFAREQLQGNPWDKVDEYLRVSPLFSIDKVNTPVLIIHSIEDYRCPLDQALTLYTALKVRGVETKLALFPAENHDLSRSGTPRRRVKRLELEIEWLREKLGQPRTPSSP